LGAGRRSTYDAAMPVLSGAKTARAGLLAGLATLAILAAVAAPPGRAAAPATPGAPGPPACAPAAATAACPAPAGADVVLSNQTTFTTWAYAGMSSDVHQSPSGSSPRLTTLHLSTEDGFPEVYVVLRQRVVGRKTWAQVRVPRKPVAVTGWVPRTALDDFNRITTELVLDRARERLRLYRAGRLVLDVPAGVGTPSTPTPAGSYWLREGFPVRGVGAYGPYAFGTSAYSSTLTDWPGGGVIGLHGTDEPQLIPGRPSHGCIRLRNADILALSRLVSIGTPLLVR
jgi:lipoprotein-anchoring transpeptidase ErfK/SrfK